MVGKYLENVRKKSPLIHNITNYVTANDVANILLACGGSAVMADAPEEAEEITSLCSGLCINLGTLNRDKLSAMILSGKHANRLGIPVVLDPVGAGSSEFRTSAAEKLISEVKFSVIRGNISEIKTLLGVGGDTKGVDASSSDMKNSIDSTAELASLLAVKTGSVVVISGKNDIISDGIKTGIVKNGCSIMSKITGSGCMLTAITAAFASANTENIFEAAVSAVALMGVCGETAFEKTQNIGGGNAAFRNNLIDAVFNMDGITFERRADYEIY